MTQDDFVLGVDIGGTHFRMGLCSSTGALLDHYSLPTNTLESASAGLVSLADKLDPDHRANRVVAGVPGLVNYHDLTLVYAPNLPPGFSDELSAKKISGNLSREAHLVNDADLAAIGECFYGSARDFESFAYVTVSTGVGAAVMYHKKLLHTRFSTGELGHSYISANYNDKNNAATVEQLASGTAMAKMAKMRGINIANNEILALAEKGDKETLALADEIAWNAAIALVNMVNLFSVDALVLGGGVILSGDFMFDLIVNKFESLRPKYFTTHVVRAQLADNAGLFGAINAHRALW